MSEETPQSVGNVKRVEGQQSKEGFDTGGSPSDEGTVGEDSGNKGRGESSKVDSSGASGGVDNATVKRLVNIVEQLQLVISDVEQRVDTLDTHIKSIMNQWELRFGPAGNHCPKCGRGMAPGTTHNCGGSALTAETIKANQLKHQANKDRRKG